MDTCGERSVLACSHSCGHVRVGVVIALIATVAIVLCDNVVVLFLVCQPDPLATLICHRIVPSILLFHNNGEEPWKSFPHIHRGRSLQSDAIGLEEHSDPDDPGLDGGASDLFRAKLH